MSDEINYTLEWLEECGENDYIFETGNSKQLLNYITNLQEENSRLRMRNDMLRKDIDSFIQDNKIDYKSRIDKAIDFINIYTDGINLEAFDCLKLMYKIRDILQGENNE